MIFFILIFALFLRIINLNQSLWLDEAINVLAVKNYSLLNLITQYSTADFHPPAFSIILWYWAKIFGYSEVALRMPSVLFGVLTIFVVFLIGQKLLSKNLGIIAAILLCFNPLHIYYSQEARVYSFAAFVVSLNFYFFIKLLKEEKVSLLYLVLSNFLVLMSDYLAFFIFPAQLLAILITRKKINFRWIFCIFSAIFLSLWWIPIFISQLHIGLGVSSILPVWKSIVGSFDLKTLPLTFVKFIIGRISLADKFLYTLLLIPLCSFVAFLLWKGFIFSTNNIKKILLSWLLTPLLLASVISLVIPIYSYFRLLYILPAFAILISLGILSFRPKVKMFFFSGIILIELISTSLYLFLPVYHREDWKGLVKFIKDRDGIVLFESSGIFSPFDYYAKGDLNAIGGLKKFPAGKIEDVIEPENFTKYTKIYLVDYLVEISDPGRLISSTIEANGYEKKDTYNFNGVGFVYLYQK